MISLVGSCHSLWPVPCAYHTGPKDPLGPLVLLLCVEFSRILWHAPSDTLNMCLPAGVWTPGRDSVSPHLSNSAQCSALGCLPVLMLWSWSPLFRARGFVGDPDSFTLVQRVLWMSWRVSSVHGKQNQTYRWCKPVIYWFYLLPSWC